MYLKYSFVVICVIQLAQNYFYKNVRRIFNNAKLDLHLEAHVLMS